MNMYRLKNERVIAFYLVPTYDDARTRFECFFPPFLRVTIEVKRFTDELRFIRSMRMLEEVSLVEPCIVDRAVRELKRGEEGCILAYKRNEGIAKPMKRTV